LNLVVAAFLVHPEENLRYIAINVLSFHWDMTQDARVFQQISQSDKDDDVRGIALRAMSYQYRSPSGRSFWRMVPSHLRSARSCSQGKGRRVAVMGARL
jgi:hypothetical protein